MTDWAKVLLALRKHDDCGGQASNETIVYYNVRDMCWMVGERGRRPRPVNEETAKWWLSE